MGREVELGGGGHTYNDHRPSAALGGRRRNKTKRSFFQRAICLGNSDDARHGRTLYLGPYEPANSSAPSGQSAQTYVFKYAVAMDIAPVLAHIFFVFTMPGRRYPSNV